MLKGSQFLAIHVLNQCGEAVSDYELETKNVNHENKPFLSLNYVSSMYRLLLTAPRTSTFPSCNYLKKPFLSSLLFLCWNMKATIFPHSPWCSVSRLYIQIRDKPPCWVDSQAGYFLLPLTLTAYSKHCKQPWRAFKLGYLQQTSHPLTGCLGAIKRTAWLRTRPSTVSWLRICSLGMLWMVGPSAASSFCDRPRSEPNDSDRVRWSMRTCWTQPTYRSTDLNKKTVSSLIGSNRQAKVTEAYFLHGLLDFSPGPWIS